MKADAAETIDDLLQQWSADTDKAFAVCIARRSVIVLHKAYGERDGKPMTVKNRSWMASITKTMSASLMMMMVDRGRIDLETPINTVLPQFAGVTSKKPLTVRQLYTHTHGLEDFLKPTDEWPDFSYFAADALPAVKVGQRWNYNGVGYTLGGKVIEQLSGEAIPQFYRNHLLGPLGMDDTDVSGTHADCRSTPLDIARFGQMLLNGGSYGDKRFFREETFRRMLPTRLTAALGPDTGKSWGMGLDGRPPRIYHGAASSATFQLDLEQNLVIVMTRNAMGKNYDKYFPRFMETVRGAIQR